MTKPSHFEIGYLPDEAISPDYLEIATGKNPRNDKICK